MGTDNKAYEAGEKENGVTHFDPSKGSSAKGLSLVFNSCYREICGKSSNICDSHLSFI